MNCYERAVQCQGGTKFIVQIILHSLDVPYGDTFRIQNTYIFEDIQNSKSDNLRPTENTVQNSNLKIQVNVLPKTEIQNRYLMKLRRQKIRHIEIESNSNQESGLDLGESEFSDVLRNSSISIFTVPWRTILDELLDKGYFSDLLGLHKLSFGTIEYRDSPLPFFANETIVEDSSDNQNIDLDLLQNRTQRQQGNIYASKQVVQLRTFNRDEYIPLFDLQNPILFRTEFNLSVIEDRSSLNEKYLCKYWNETLESWQSNGCELSNVTKRWFADEQDEFAIVECQCFHTTRFTHFIEFSSEDTLDLSELYILASVLSLIVMTLSIVTLVILVRLRNEKIVKSRVFIVHLGEVLLILTSIIVFIEAILYLSSTEEDRSRSLTVQEIIQQVSSMLTSLFFITICIMYMTQCLKYIVSKYYYEIMYYCKNKRNESPFRKKNSWIHFVVARKTFLVISILSVSLPLSIYYAVIFILRITQTIDGLASTMAFSIPTFVIYVLCGVGVLSIMFGIGAYLQSVHVQISSIRNEIMESLSLNSREESAAEMVTERESSEETANLPIAMPSKKRILEQADKYDLKNAKVVYHELLEKGAFVSDFLFRTDPLQFRIESLIFISAFFVYVILGVIGFVLISYRFSEVSQSSQSRIALEYLSRVFEFVFQVLMVLSFGGWIAIYTIYQRISKKNSLQDKLLKKKNTDIELKEQKSGSSTTPQEATHNSGEENTQQESKEENVEELDFVLSHNYFYKMFVQYLKNEFSLENLLGYEELKIIYSFVKEQKLQNGEVQQQTEQQQEQDSAQSNERHKGFYKPLYQTFKTYHSKYLDNNSQYELNLSSLAVNSFKSILKTLSHYDKCSGNTNKKENEEQITIERVETVLDQLEYDIRRIL
jgi:hypothetical protein